MKIFFIVLVFLAFCIAQQKKHITSTVKSTSLSYMKIIMINILLEVKLIEKRCFQNSFTKLMGKEKFQDLEDFFNVESPITIKNNVMVCFYGCMHN